MRIIIRKKGKTEYFYLQHSFRKDGKTMTKERYLGKKIPDNIEEIKANLMLQAKKALSEKLEEIKNDFQQKWGRIPESAKEKELQELAIVFTYNSNAIEGSTITLEEARLILVEKLILQLIAFVDESELNPVEVAAGAHYLFEKIHPFGDGNGRIGRLLMNCILWKNGYPMLIIEYKKRKSYYKALQRTEDGFTNYFTRRYIAVHRKRLRT